MSDVVCDFLVPLDSFETKPTFLEAASSSILSQSQSRKDVEIRYCHNRFLHCLILRPEMEQTHNALWMSMISPI